MDSEQFNPTLSNFLELSPLTPALLPAAVALDQICFGGLWTLDGYQRELDSPNSDLLSLCLFPSVPVSPPLLIGLGCLWAILEEAHITIVAVHPNFQRQGFGQLILQALLQKACDRGLERATLEVRVSNQAALKLYKKFGFREAGRRKRYYQDTGEDALILWRGGLQTQDFQQTLEQWQQQLKTHLHQSGWLLCSIS